MSYDALEANAEAFASLKTERQQMTMIVDFAKMLGWGLAYHTQFSLRSDKGFPDLVLVYDRDLTVGAGRMLALELKVGSLPSLAQVVWIDALGNVPGVRAAIVRPGDPRYRDWRWIEPALRLDPSVWGE